MGGQAGVIADIGLKSGADVGPLTDICGRWEEARRRGEDPSPEELCRDHPELVGQVRTAISDLRRFDRAAGPAAPQLPPGCPYRLLRFLAEGGLGQVYVGYEDALEREVAVKFVRPDRLAAEDAVRRFELEARLTGRVLEHPGIPPVYGLVRDPESGTVAYAMRLLPGQTFQKAGDELHARGFKPDGLRKLLPHFVRACRTVGYAHGKGVVHRDVKPSNLMAGPGDQTWVLDWGIARVVNPIDPEAFPAGETQAGAVLGTPAYMAPEQAAGQVERVQAAADVYALGGVLYFLLLFPRLPHNHAARSSRRSSAARISSSVSPGRSTARISFPSNSRRHA
ncbi:MAG TPA: serine/threonine-protein kinase, partial [Urbifossiella sp.]|nr:serine/threonine-protein kinase [Urbifossiella sp.]